MSNTTDTEERPPTIARERFERIYGIIRDRICLLEYAPGMRLGEEDLAKEFGVSRTPIRRVLSRLETEGLLESRHGVGTFVTTIPRPAAAAVSITLYPVAVTPM